MRAAGAIVMSKRRLIEALLIASIAATSMFGSVAHGQSDSPDAASPAVPLEASTVYESMARLESVTSFVYSDFVSHVDRGDVREVMIAGASVTGKLMDETRFRTIVPDDPDMISSLLKHGVRVAVAPTDGSSASDGFMMNWLPIALLVIVTIFMMSRGSFRGGGAATFGHSRARLLTKTSRLITFADVAGIEEAQQELVEIVQYLKDPPKFQRLGARVSRGVLLVGPPGTGKTLLARAVAGEAGVPFFTISGSDFVEMFVGVGAARVRDMFSEGKKNAPCIIFIDEIDAVGRVRGTGTGNEEREQTINQLLVEMDGFDPSEDVIVIAATNRPDVLDPALLRPGRFDRQVVVSYPNIMGRERILSVHLRKVPVGPDVNFMALARGTPGFSGADLAHLVNEAALLAVRSDHPHVTSVDFEQARDKIMMGAERRSLTTTSEEREMTAWHEGGHALVAFHLPDHDPLHKVSIVPRSRALGVTITLPERDRHSVSRKELDSRIAMMFGGLVAEELIYGRDEVTTGASDDIRQATMLARRMVTEFGFSDTLGPVYYGSRQEIFSHLSADVSPATELAIEKEIRRITERGRATARRILAGHMNELELLARALIERETLSGDEISVLLKGNLSERPSMDIESSLATRTIKAL
jgi:cell division protease FtsH